MKWLAAVLLAGVVTSSPAVAQEALPTVPAPVIMVDTDRLYTDSAFGKSLRDEIEAQIAQLNVENARIVADLTEEEQSLAQRKPDMDRDAFRAEAEAFDIKVQDIRAARDAKEAELQRAQAVARQQFFAQASPIVGQLMERRGAIAVLDVRAVFVYVGTLDVTDAAIAAIDATLLDPAQ